MKCGFLESGITIFMSWKFFFNLLFIKYEYLMNFSDPYICKFEMSLILFTGEPRHYCSDSECNGHWCLPGGHTVEHHRAGEVEPPLGLFCPPDSLLPPRSPLSHRPRCVSPSQQVRTIPCSRSDLQRSGSGHKDQSKWAWGQRTTPVQTLISREKWGQNLVLFTYPGSSLVFVVIQTKECIPHL